MLSVHFFLVSKCHLSSTAPTNDFTHRKHCYIQHFCTINHLGITENHTCDLQVQQSLSTSSTTLPAMWNHRSRPPKTPKGQNRDLSCSGRITSWQDAYICQFRSMAPYKYLLFQSPVNTSASSQPVCPFKEGNWNLYSQIISKGQEM